MKSEAEIRELIAVIQKAIEDLNDLTSNESSYPARQMWFDQMYTQIDLLKWVLGDL